MKLTQQILSAYVGIEGHPNLHLLQLTQNTEQNNYSRMWSRLRIKCEGSKNNYVKLQSQIYYCKSISTCLKIIMNPCILGGWQKFYTTRIKDARDFFLNA